MSDFFVTMLHFHKIFFLCHSGGTNDVAIFCV